MDDIVLRTQGNDKTLVDFFLFCKEYLIPSLQVPVNLCSRLMKTQVDSGGCDSRGGLIELSWRPSRYSVHEDNRKMTTYREMKVLHITVRDTAAHFV